MDKIKLRLKNIIIRKHKSYLPISDIFGLLARTPCSFFNAETPGWGILKSNFGVDPEKNDFFYNFYL